MTDCWYQAEINFQKYISETGLMSLSDYKKWSFYVFDQQSSYKKKVTIPWKYHSYGTLPYSRLKLVLKQEKRTFNVNKTQRNKTLFEKKAFFKYLTGKKYQCWNPTHSDQMCVELFNYHKRNIYPDAQRDILIRQIQSDQIPYLKTDHR